MTNTFLELIGWRADVDTKPEEVRLLVPVLTAIAALHGHTCGSGDILTNADDVASWLEWRASLKGGWRMSESDFDAAVQHLAFSAVDEYEEKK